jgi:hypothetical protein
MIKKSGLSHIRRAVEMPLPSLMTKPKEEVKATITKLSKLYKPK